MRLIAVVESEITITRNSFRSKDVGAYSNSNSFENFITTKIGNKSRLFFYGKFTNTIIPNNYMAAKEAG